MSRTFFQTTLSRVAIVASSLAMSACSAGYSTDNSSSVLFIVAAVNDGNRLSSDVAVGDSGAVVGDLVSLQVAVRFKNPNIETVPSIPNAVIVERYEVRYRRSDGRGVEGQDVPYTISGNITTAFDVKTSGTDPLTIEVVRAQAKLDPPLRNLRGVTTGSLGGAFIVTMFADITIIGRTISGIPVTGKGSLQIDFADFPDA